MNIRVSVSTILLTLAMIANTTAIAQNTYTNDSFKGDFLIAESGSGSGGSVVVLGTLKADGNGFITGRVFQRLPGRVASPATTEGQYTINQDGTGTMMLRYNTSDAESELADSGVLRFYDIVLTQKRVSATGSGAGVLSIADLQQQTASGSSAVLKGVYGFKEFGVTNTSAVAMGVGEFQFDGTGGVRGTIGTRTEGAAPHTIAFTGNYIPEAGGIGEITIQYSSPSAGAEGEEVQISRSRFRIITADGVVRGMRLDSNVFTLAEFLKQ